MKYFTNIIAVLSFFIGTLLINHGSNAAPTPVIGDGFNYQGELISNGVPANGLYDFGVKAYDAASNNANLIGATQIIPNIVVTDGLFNLNDVIFQQNDIYLDREVIWLEILVKSDADQVFTTLSPKQKLHAVPYSISSETSFFAEESGIADVADKLAAGNAQNGQILQFNQGSWSPTSLAHPWESTAISAFYLDGRVGVGTDFLLARFQIDSSANEDPLRVRVENSTKLMVKKDGKVGIGTASPISRLDIKGGPVEPPLRISSNNTLRFEMTENDETIANDFFQFNGQVNLQNLTNLNGQTYFSGSTYLNGSTYFNTDTKQDDSANGMLKYSVKVRCNNANDATIESQYNGTTSAGNITISPIESGRCIINFPTEIVDRYWVSSLYKTTTAAISSCKNLSILGNNNLECRIRKASNNSLISGFITILVY